MHHYALPPGLSQAHPYVASVFYPLNLPATNSLILESEGDLSSDAQGNPALFATGLETIQDMFDKIRWRGFAHLLRHQEPEAELVVVCDVAQSLPSLHYPFSETRLCYLEGGILEHELPSVLHCLRVHSEAGIKVKHLEVQGTSKIRHVGQQPEDFRPLANVFVFIHYETPINENQ